MKSPFAIIFTLSSVCAKLKGSAPPSVTHNGANRNLDVVECDVSEVHGLNLPGSPRVPVQYACTTDEGDAVFFDGDVSNLLLSKSIDSKTRIALPQSAIRSDGKISVQKAMALGAAPRNIFSENRERKLTTTGQKDVLVILVVGNDDAPTQSEATMFNDVFGDENNLKVRYDDCSNGALIFNPATGANVNNGVITVTTTENLNGMAWQTCGAIGTHGANGISRQFTMIVCPNSVNFGGSAAWGSIFGSTSWYRSMYASVPMVQMHEIGHNLGHTHSGKNGVTYDDPTCNMGNKGSISDAGTNFCFNAAKTWANKWYEVYHKTVNPSSGTYDGTLVGINAVASNTIAQSGQDVVLKIASSGETDLYVMFNREAGANNGVPSYGDQIVIVEQRTESSESSWKAALSENQEYIQSGWSGSGTLVVKVCSLETGSPGSAHILVYATGQATLSCDDANNTPTISPVTASPVSSPVLSTVTKAPVVFNDDSCQDGTAKFIWPSNGKKRPCKYVFKKRTKRCNNPVAADYCPTTCKKSNCVCKDSLEKFKVGKKGIERSCLWAAAKRSKTKKRCRNSIIRSYCPEACGIC